MGIGVLNMENPDHRVLHAKVQHIFQYGNIVNLANDRLGSCCFTGDTINSPSRFGFRNVIFFEKVSQRFTVRGWKDESNVIGYFVSSKVLDQIREFLNWEGEAVIISPLFFSDFDMEEWNIVFDFLPTIRALSSRRDNVIDILDWKRQILIMLTSDWRRTQAQINPDLYHRVADLIYKMFAPYPEKVSNVYVTVSYLADKYGDSDLYAIFVFTDNNTLSREYSGFLRRWRGIFEEVDVHVETFPMTGDFNKTLEKFSACFQYLYGVPHVTLSDGRGTFQRFSIFSSIGLRSWGDISERYSLSYED